MSTCNPTLTDCPPDMALGMTQYLDFTEKFVTDQPYFYIWPGVDWTDEGLVMTVTNETSKPFILFSYYLFFGRVDVTLKPLHGAGIATILALYSDDLDEIAWAFVGADNAHGQSDYIGQLGRRQPGQPDQTVYHSVQSAVDTKHTYSIDWNSSSITWLLDGSPVRTVTYSDAKDGANFPQTPLQPRVYSYVVGTANASYQDWTWGGGYANFSQGPFVGSVYDIRMQDYMNGNTSALEYVYTDKSGNYEAISVVPNTARIAATSRAKSTTLTTPTSSQSATPKPTKDNAGSSDQINPGVIAGAVIGGVVAFLIVGLVIFFWRRRKQKGQGGGAKGGETRS
ncbi:concanavalin A-like lectin/glucanase [Thozetella sp. PMI_491]|nr:concanavalin A-like lectin/glucanase [Thozetella sp. PMI_491]